MKTLLQIASLFAMAFLTGCFTENGKLPQADVGYTPKQVYTASYEQVWKAVLNALDKNNVITLSVDKASGIINTDYVAGPGFYMPGSSQNTRYKFSVIVRGQDDGTVRLKVICKIETSFSGEHGANPYRDVTPRKKALADKLEGWLYEQIETQTKSTK